VWRERAIGKVDLRGRFGAFLSCKGDTHRFFIPFSRTLLGEMAQIIAVSRHAPNVFERTMSASRPPARHLRRDAIDRRERKFGSLRRAPKHTGTRKRLVAITVHALNATRSTSPVWLKISASVNSPVARSPLFNRDVERASKQADCHTFPAISVIISRGSTSKLTRQSSRQYR
jgi:hypothetical protein